MFNVSLTCGRNSSHSWRGQSVSTVARAAMQCSLKVAMACSVALTQWLLGGDEMDVNFLGPDILFDSVGTFVVNHIQCWLVTLDFRMVITLVNACTMEASVQEGMARTMIAMRS